MKMNIYTSIIHHIQHPPGMQERKMDTMKKTLAMLLAAIMLLAMLTACGGNNNTAGNGDNTANNAACDCTGGIFYIHRNIPIQPLRGGDAHIFFQQGAQGL